MEDIVEKLRETFREEAYELLAELEAGLLELEHNPGDGAQVGRVFRAMHTIKGSGATCEFHHIATFTHELETTFDKVRKGKIAATKELIDLALVARDYIQSQFDAFYKGGAADESKGAEIFASLKKLLPGSAGKGLVAPAAGPSTMKNKPAREEPAKNVTYRIRFRPERQIFASGTDPVLLLRELCRLGSCRVLGQIEAIPWLEDYQADECYTFWDGILTTKRGRNRIDDIFIF